MQDSTSYRQCSIEGCERKHYSLGYCSKHYFRVKRLGTTELPAQGSTELFERQVNKSGRLMPHMDLPCWEWQGNLAGAYGKVWFDGKTVRAHRFSYELAYGPIPEGQSVLHQCDNPLCVNPAHLFLGTQQENIQDKVVKGRQPQGEKVKTHKLSTAHVLEIKRKLASGALQKDLASEYGATRENISSISTGKTWSWLKP